MTISNHLGRGFGGGRRRTWTAEQDAVIRSMAAAKCTVREVAAHFGVTRNMIIGRARRMRPPVIWDLQPPVVGKRCDGQPSKPKVERRRGRPPVNGHYPSSYDMIEDLPPQDAPPSLALAIWQLRDGVCHYPYGTRAPYTFCGHTALKGCSYCAYHKALTCAPTQRPSAIYLPPTIADV